MKNKDNNKSKDNNKNENKKPKVLCIPSSECNALFKQLFSIAKMEMGWEFVCISPKYYFQYYRNFLDSEDQLYDFPDLLNTMDWESDSKERQHINELMSAAETKLGIPIHRILLSCDRNIGRMYSKYNFYQPEGRIAKAALKDKVFSQTVLQRSFKFAFDILKNTRPDFCLGAPPSGIMRLAFYYLAYYYDIPYLSSIFSMVLPNRHYWSVGWGGFNDQVEQVFHELKAKEHQSSKEALQYIEDFRHRPEPMPIYIDLWRNDKKTHGILGIHKLIVNRLLHRVIPIVKGISVSNPKPFFQFVLDVYRTFFLKRRQYHFYQRFSSDELKQLKYIYYPCHVDPEFVLSLRAPNWYDQLNTIKKLSYNLPYGYRLLVREHRYNLGRKRTRYLKELMSYPGVVFVDAHDDQYKYIQHADLVVTVNGTSGFEGLLLAKKLLTLDRTNYDPIVKTTCFHRDNDLGAAILMALRDDNIPDDKAMALFIDAEKMTTFCDQEANQTELLYLLNLVRKLNRTYQNKPETVLCS